MDRTARLSRPSRDIIGNPQEKEAALHLGEHRGPIDDALPVYASFPATDAASESIFAE